MARIRAKDTSPELVVRSYLHGRGLRYRLHVPNLPGKPDLVFVRRRVCVFVDGCFWHGCRKCKDGTRIPKTNECYWQKKINGNRRRDRENRDKLKRDGWKVLVIMGCEIRSSARLAELRKEIERARNVTLHRIGRVYRSQPKTGHLR